MAYPPSIERLRLRKFLNLVEHGVMLCNPRWVCKENARADPLNFQSFVFR